jgi:hypothetical protein
MGAFFEAGRVKLYEREGTGKFYGSFSLLAKANGHEKFRT